MGTPMRINRRKEDPGDQQQNSGYSDSSRSSLSLRDAMNRLFDESFLDPFSRLPGLGRQMGFPRIDMSESAGEITITANIPAVDAEHIDIEVDENSLTIRGVIEQSKEDADRHFYRAEREYGEFRREIPLPTSIKPSEVTAAVRNGVLMIRLPKQKANGRMKVKAKAE